MSDVRLRRAAIIAVGSELLTPLRTDTNSLFLTRQLDSLGVEVVLKILVGDDRDELAHAVRTAAQCRAGPGTHGSSGVNPARTPGAGRATSGPNPSANSVGGLGRNGEPPLWRP